MDNKYYTPSIEDIRVGYELEVRLPNHQEYIKETIKRDDLLYLITYCDLLDRGCLRVEYLNKEQIEAEGWVDKKKDGTIKFELEKPVQYAFGKVIKDSFYFLFLQDNNKITIKVAPNYIKTGNYHTLYSGNCQTINELRLISKMIGI